MVIHQLNEPRWEVHAPSSAPTTKTVHIAYLNGDHYCSVQSISPAESAVPLPLLQLTGDTGKGEEKPHTSKVSSTYSFLLCYQKVATEREFPYSSIVVLFLLTLPLSSSLQQELKSTSHFCEPTSLSLTERVAVSTGCKVGVVLCMCCLFAANSLTPLKIKSCGEISIHLLSVAVLLILTIAIMCYILCTCRTQPLLNSASGKTVTTQSWPSLKFFS